MVRVGFIINFKPSRWLGGYNYYKNLFQCLNNFPEKKIKPVIITDKPNDYKNDEVISKLEIIKTNLVSRSNIYLKVINKILIIIFGRNFFLDKFLQKNNILVLSHSGWIGNRSKVLNFPWIPDFQELHNPKNFDLIDRIIRKFRIFFCYYYSTSIIVSSKSVQKDLRKISKKAVNKSLLIKHVVRVPKYSQLKSLKYLKKKYKINEKFFFLPNHYWKHKNHEVVLKALASQTKEQEYQIISTGNFSDHRHPSYINNLKKYINNNNLNKKYKILNIIPYIDVMSLMFHSIALINPSKSEGWSNTVEQGKSMKKKIILSKINVHLEQKNSNCIFFNPDDFKNLNKILNREFKKFKKRKKNFYNKNYEFFNKQLENQFIYNYQKSILKFYKKI